MNASRSSHDSTVDCSYCHGTLKTFAYEPLHLHPLLIAKGYTPQDPCPRCTKGTA